MSTSVDEDQEFLELLFDRIRRRRAQMTRQTTAIGRTRDDMHHTIRDALELGASPTRLAKLSGYTIARIYQIRDMEVV
jgi:hypothetical protein